MVTTVIDGRNLIHGRLASIVAQKIMSGEEVIVVNAEAIVVTGIKKTTFSGFKMKVDRGDTTKRKGPFYPRRADALFKRCVRGMIPWTTSSGRCAYRKLHVFIGMPKQFDSYNKECPDKACRKISGKYTTLGDISRYLGFNMR